jgi:hypothetical protein
MYMYKYVYSSGTSKSICMIICTSTYMYDSVYKYEHISASPLYDEQTINGFRKMARGFRFPVEAQHM